MTGLKNQRITVAGLGRFGGGIGQADFGRRSNFQAHRGAARRRAEPACVGAGDRRRRHLGQRRQRTKRAGHILLIPEGD